MLDNLNDGVYFVDRLRRITYWNKGAERLHALVGRSRLTVQRRRLEVTVSIGATLVAPGDTPEGIIRRADALLHQSKVTGRDRITADCN